MGFKKNGYIIIIKKKEDLYGYEGCGDFTFQKESNYFGNINNYTSNRNLVYTGVQLLNPQIFKNIKKKIFSLKEIFKKVMEKDKLYGLIDNNKWFHVGNMKTLHEINFKKKMNLIIYDFETSGRSARYDQILQAGIILYDKNLVEIKQLNLKSKLNADVIPSINALNVNKIYLSDLLKEKKTSFEIIQEMNDFFEKHRPSMFLGYNSINFDEEFLRQGLWENFLYPYVTTTRDNKRGDVLNLVRMAHAQKPDIIKITQDDVGKLSFKLENISKENNFDILQSHEAISDVIATKKVFELVKKNAQDIYKDFIDNTDKKS